MRGSRKWWGLVALGVVVAASAAVLALAVSEQRVGDGPIVTGTSLSPDSREVAFVANAVAGTVTVYDLDRRQVVGTIDVVPDGRKVGLFRHPLQALVGQPRTERAGGLNFAQDIDVSPDGRVLYVSRGNLADVAAFDLATGRLLWREPVGVGRADHMALTPDGRFLFVSSLAAAEVKRIDTRSGEVDGGFATAPFPHDNQFSADGRRIYNASLGDMTVPEAGRGQAADGANPYQITVADVGTLEVIDRLPFPRGIRPFHLTPDGSRLYAQLSNTHAVVEYDVAARKIVRRLDLPVAAGVTADDWDFDAPHHGLAMTPDGQRLCIAGRASDYAAIVATAPLALVATVPVSDAPSWAAIDSVGRYCLTANNRADDVTVISMADALVVDRFPTGRGTKHITLARVPAATIATIEAR